MLTLLVDNYDSFTYNLFDLLAQVNGIEPVVVYNDDPVPTVEEVEATFDNVVISPGPGRPDRVEDFGRWGDLIRASRIPLLGVCLGHQGICHFHGGRIDSAPEPQHGRVSSIFHNGGALFSGLPSPFSAVRYHSLAVLSLPDEMEATAWTSDGVLMAAQHRTLPQWGVQFHPESIATEHGRLILGNFRRLTESRRAREAAAPSSFSESSITRRPRTPMARTNGIEPRVQRVLVQTVETTTPDEVIFAELYGASATAFWLDSSISDPLLARFSFMGDASGPHARVAVADVWEATVTVGSQDVSDTWTGSFFDWLRTELQNVRVDVPDGLPFDFALGWVGYLGYELKAECGGNRAHRATEPDAMLLFADRALVSDHLTKTIYLLTLADGEEDGEARQWLNSTADRIARIGPFVEAAMPASLPVLNIEALRTRDEYLQLIDRCKKAISAGETYEVCLTNMLHVEATVDSWQAYRFLRRASPAPYGAFVRFPSMSILSTSPERFLRVAASGMVESKPIKGTRRRGSTPVEDDVLRSDLQLSEKDRAENLMIVDLMRNDLGRCAEVGTIEVPRLFEVETYATVHQLVSTVRAQLSAGLHPVDCVRSAFPGGSMTGAPKIRTLQIIDDLEGTSRGVYAGAIGYFSLSGSVDLGMAIRTIVAKSECVKYGVGGAIIALSDPVSEYAEIETKAEVFFRLFGCTSSDWDRE